MKKCFYSLLMFILFLNGCSRLVKQSVLEGVSYGDWTKDYNYNGYWDGYFSSPYTNYWNRYDNDEFSILVAPSQDQSNSLLFGPACCITFFPNIFHMRENSSANRIKYFYVDMIIESKNYDQTIDLSEFRFDNEGDILKPSVIKKDEYLSKGLHDSLTIHDYYSGRWIDSSSEDKHNIYKIRLVKCEEDTINTSKNIVAIRFEFNELNGSIDDLTIIFGNIINNISAVSIPDLKFSNKNMYFYVPYEFGH